MKLRNVLALMALPLILAACTVQESNSQRAQPAASSGNAQLASEPIAGTDYIETDTPPFQPGTGKIEVAEVFGYTCSHCADLQPIINDWERTLPDDVNFIAVPGAFGGYWNPFAQAFFAAEEMGVLDKTHDAMFEAVRQRQFPDANIETFAKVYSGFGVDPKAFTAAFNGPRVAAKMKRAQQFAVQAKIEGTPSMVVNGRYTVPVGRKGFEGMLATVDWLVERERNSASATHQPAQ
ncbi:MAG: thiol:disulfide interchange protein DsbA/DsbL [Xanthomonadaceae bacterium]|jgi:thiol:disulfide interchange protein DsbA|nr:thiol:disulfide interchange protein DsbA/DsbL [Xanthomonadaceae bacterium]